MKKALIVFCGGLLILAHSCTKNKVEDYEVQTPPPPIPKALCDSLSPTYSATIQPIIGQNCTNTCHKSGSNGSFLLLTSLEDVKDAIQNKHLLEAIKHEAPYSPMPKGGNKLPDGLIQRLECWKNNGFPQ